MTYQNAGWPKTFTIWKTTLLIETDLTNQTEYNLPKLWPKKLRWFWKPDFAENGHCQKKRTCAKVTWPKNTPNNYKPQLTRTVTNGKNEIWKPETKWTKTKNLQMPPLKKWPNPKNDFAFWDKPKTKLAIQRRICFCSWLPNGLR